jgi:hypothetical protein
MKLEQTGKIKTTRTGKGIVIEALALAAEKKPGCYLIKNPEMDNLLLNKTDSRANFFLNGSRIPVKKLKELFENPPEEAQTEPMEPGSDSGLKAKDLEKKYKTKKVLKAVTDWEPKGLKKKQRKALVSILEEAGKKVTGQSVLVAVESVNNSIGSHDLVELIQSI